MLTFIQFYIAKIEPPFFGHNTVCVTVQMLDSVNKYDSKTLHREFERRCDEKPTEQIRFCPHAIINNIDVAFIIQPASLDIETGPKLTDKTAYLFARYARLINATVNQKSGATIFDKTGQPTTAQLQFKLNKFILTEDVVEWGLFHCKFSQIIFFFYG